MVWLYGANRRRGGRGRQPVPTPPEAAEFGAATFPPVKEGQQWKRLRTLAAAAEELSGIRGLYSFLLGTAKGESDAVPSAMNTKTDGGPALRLLCRDQNYNGRYPRKPLAASAV